MNNDISISVIVPVYKAEQYLSKCIDSILAQTYTLFELLLIDDGSPDKSGIICDEYAAKDTRIRVYHKENGGVTSARKLGITSAVGEYVFFVDADDDLPAASLESCLSFVINKDVDILVTAENRVVNNKITNVITNVISGHVDNRSYAVAMFRRECRVGPHARLIKRSLFNKVNAFDMPRELVMNEDLLMNMILGTCANNIYISNDIISYNYHYRADGASQTKSSVKYWEMTFSVFRKHLYNLYNINNELENAFVIYKLYSIYNLTWDSIENISKAEFIRKIKLINNLNIEHKKILNLLEYPKLSVFIKVFFKIYSILTDCIKTDRKNNKCKTYPQ